MGRGAGAPGSSRLQCEQRRPGDALIDDRDTHRHRWEETGGIFIHHRGAVSIRAPRTHGFL